MNKQKVSTPPSLIEKMVSAGTAACIADMATFPFDVAKVRLQVSGETLVKPLCSGGAIMLEASAPQFKGLFGTLLYLARTEGPRSLYGGIVPGLQRQCLFASLRIGMYDGIKDFYAKKFNLNQKNYTSLIFTRILSGITSGAIAITVAQPTDVVKVRMQANKNCYRNSFHAYRTIYSSEGLAGLWKGLGPNVARNSIVNAAELVCYDTIKDLLVKHLSFSDNLNCHFVSAFGAGFCATVVASPIDVVKTRIMNSKVGKYDGMIDCARGMIRTSGWSSFYKGFTPSFMRMGTWNVVMFVTYEQLKKFSQQQNDKTMEKNSTRTRKSSLNARRIRSKPEYQIIGTDEEMMKIPTL